MSALSFVVVHLREVLGVFSFSPFSFVVYTPVCARQTLGAWWQRAGKYQRKRPALCSNARCLHVEHGS